MSGGGDSSKLERWLVAHGISNEDLAVAHRTAQFIDGSLGAALVLRGTIDADTLATALSEVYALARWDGTVDDSLVQRLTRDVCRRELMAPVALRGRTLVLATADPTRHEGASALAMAAGARDAELVVGADPAIFAALTAGGSGLRMGELARTLASYRSNPNDEARIRERRMRDGAFEPPTARLANFFALAVLEPGVTALRFVPSIDDSVALLENGTWAIDNPFAELSLPSAVLTEAAIHLTHMAGLERLDEPGSAILYLSLGRARVWHGGSLACIDVDLETTVAGLCVVLSRAAVRMNHESTTDEEKSGLDDYGRAWDLVRAGNNTRAAEALASSEAKLWKADGKNGSLAGSLLHGRGRLLENEGRLEEALDAFGDALRCRDISFDLRTYATLDALRGLLASERPSEVVALGRSFADDATAWYGAPSLSALLAMFLVARAHVARGEAALASRVADVIAGWAPAMTPFGPFVVAWVRGLVRREEGRLAAAEGELRVAVERLSEAGDRIGGLFVNGRLHMDLASVVARQKRTDEARRILDRGRETVLHLPATHADRIAIERAVAALAGVHPYR